VVPSLSSKGRHRTKPSVPNQSNLYIVTGARVGEEREW